MPRSQEAASVTRAGHRVPDPPPAWTPLPTSRSPRWFLPRGSGVTTMRSFLIHHPVTFRSRLGWAAARQIAGRGGFRFLRSSALLPREVWDPVADMIPSGGGLAVARANHPGRFFAIVMGADGELLAFAKVARDSSGNNALQHERQALETLGPLLSPPLYAPRVLDADEGFLLLEAVEWQTRPEPWRLPGQVAYALGRFFRASASGSDGSLGATHGDCTPWNLLRTSRGWALVDWESAERDVPAFLDPFHFYVQSSVELRRPTRRAIIDGLFLRGRVGAALQAYAAGAELDPALAQSLFAEYLRYSAARVSAGAPPRAIRIREDLSRRLIPYGLSENGAVREEGNSP